MRSEYQKITLKAGLDHKGNQKHREVSVRTTEIDYVLEEQLETKPVFDEESERWYNVTIQRRPKLGVTTKVVACKNRFGVVRLYGPQGFTTPLAQVLR
jgi:hypothetical protein